MEKKSRKIIKFIIEITIAAAVFFLSFLGISYMIKMADVENLKWYMKALAGTIGFFSMWGIIADVIFICNIGVAISSDFWE